MLDAYLFFIGNCHNDNVKITSNYLKFGNAEYT